MSSSYTGQIPQFLENNRTFVSDTFPKLPKVWTMEERRPVLKPMGVVSIVLTCLDPRCTPENFFGPNFSGGVIRNAGGRATDDAIRSVTALRGVLGVKTVAVVHHTDCGVTHVSHKDVVDTVAEDGPEAKAAAEKLDYKLFSPDQLEESIREDVRILKNAPTLAGVNVFGFKLETFTGEITPVHEA